MQGIKMRPPNIQDKMCIVLKGMGDVQGRIEFIHDIKSYIQSKIKDTQPSGVKSRMDIWKLTEKLKFWDKQMDSLCKNQKNE